jgi:hypothetical protein
LQQCPETVLKEQAWCPVHLFTSGQDWAEDLFKALRVQNRGCRWSYGVPDRKMGIFREWTKNRFWVNTHPMVVMPVSRCAMI